MAQIRIHITDPSGAKITPVEVPDDVPMRRLMPALAKKMQLPLKDSRGFYRIVYKLHRNQTGATLADEDSIRGVGAAADEFFTLVPELVPPPEGPITEWWPPKSTAPDPDILNVVELSAPVYVPTRDSLAIGLVPADTVYRLEEYRSDEMHWAAVMWAFVGAILGVIVNWVTSEPLVITRASAIVMVVFTLMALVTWVATREYKKRAEEMKARIFTFQEKAEPLNKPKHE